MDMLDKQVAGRVSRRNMLLPELREVIAGQRDPDTAIDPSLEYAAAVDVYLFIEWLNAREKTG
jgi:hypothetical protein